jgi:hypothetical protein
VAGALIVTAELGPADFGWLEALRRAHYPADRNQLPAHLTMFHALPPSIESEMRTRLTELARQAPPTASVEGLMDLGGGVAFRIVSPGLDAIREELAEVFLGSLGAQDSGGWRPHVTIQNKVAPREARALKESLERRFVSRLLAIHGFGLHRYLGGPWERLGLYPFRGVR